MAMRVLIEQLVIMRRANRVWVRTLEEEPSGKVTRSNYVIDTRNGERQVMSAKQARTLIEGVNQGKLF